MMKVCNGIREELELDMDLMYLIDLLKRTGAIITVEYDDVDLRIYLTISHGGNIEGNLSLGEAHQQLEKRIYYPIEKGKTPCFIGGGNDQSYPNVSALLNHLDEKKYVYVITIDAHIDVRSLKEGNKVHSESPFRLLLETKI